MLSDCFNLFVELWNVASENEYYLTLMGLGIVLIGLYLFKKSIRALK